MKISTAVDLAFSLYKIHYLEQLTTPLKLELRIFKWCRIRKIFFLSLKYACRVQKIKLNSQ